MKASPKDKDKYMGSVKVGPKGQIVIPVEIRKMFGISPGDMLVMFADAKKGIALERMNIFSRIADAILNGNGREIYPDHSDEDNIAFANAIKQMANDNDDEEKGEKKNDVNSDN